MQENRRRLAIRDWSIVIVSHWPSWHLLHPNCWRQLGGSWLKRADDGMWPISKFPAVIANTGPQIKANYNDYTSSLQTSIVHSRCCSSQSQSASVTMQQTQQSVGGVQRILGKIQRVLFCASNPVGYEKAQARNKARRKVCFLRPNAFSQAVCWLSRSHKWIVQPSTTGADMADTAVTVGQGISGPD